MQSIDIMTLVTILGSLFGGGVIGVIIKAFMERKKVNAEATNTNIKSLLEIDQRMNERMTKLEERVANLEQENYKLKSDKLVLEKETQRLKTLLTELEAEKKELYNENCSLKLEIEVLKENIKEENVNGK
jgi:predicted RNase H-like nuclease (RuvC/YqgF family)